MIQLFIVYSRVTDFIGIYLHVSSQLVFIFSILALFAVVAAGGLRHALLSRPGKLFTALTIWFVICTPFSVWKGGSVATLEGYWMKTYLYFIIVAGLIATLDDCRKVIYTVVFGTAMVCVVSLISHTGGSRFDVEGGLLGNPNELALFLILTIPYAVLMMGDRRGLFKVFGGGMAAILVVLSVRTGSRMGIIMLGVVFVMFWVRASAPKKAGLLVGAALLGAVALTLSSPGTIARYRTMFSDDQNVDLSQDNDVSNAVGSSMARRALLSEAWDYSLQHPIVGVGPGQFQAATGGNQQARSEHLAWHETHNTFLQLSSEDGFLAAFLYIAVIVYATRASLRIYKRYKRDPQNSQIASMAYALLVANIGFTVGAMFGSMAYDFAYPVIVATIVGFEQAVARHEAASRIERPTEVPRWQQWRRSIPEAANVAR